MPHVLRRLSALAITSLLAIGWGCGSGAPPVDSSTTEATVKGTVTIRGKAAKGGKINFDPSNIERKTEVARSAEIGPDGSYTIKTLVGQNQVTFSGPAFVKDAQLQDSQLQYNVPEGESTYNIELPPAAGP